MIPIFRLKVFRSVAENLSYTKAAKEMFITQPAVSKHIQEIEIFYNTSVFERIGNKIILTQAGNLLYKYTIKILEDYDALNFEMNSLNNVVKGLLRIGASSTISQYILPNIMAKFIERYPNVDISVISGNTDEMSRALLDHKIDIGIVEGVDKVQNIRYSLFREDKLVGITAKNTKMDIKKTMKLEEIKTLPIVLRELGSGTLDVFERAINKNGVKLSDLNVLLYMNGSEAIKKFIKVYDAVGFISYECIKDDLNRREYKVIDITNINLSRELMFITPMGEDKKITSVFKNFIKNN